MHKRRSAEQAEIREIEERRSIPSYHVEADDASLQSPRVRDRLREVGVLVAREPAAEGGAALPRLLEGLGRVPQLAREAHPHRKPGRTLHGARRPLSPDRRLDDLLNVLDQHAVPRRRRAVDDALEVRFADDAVGDDVDGAGDLAQDSLHLEADALDLAQVRAEDLDSHHRAESRLEHDEARLDGLKEGRQDSRDGGLLLELRQDAPVGGQHQPAHPPARLDERLVPRLGAGARHVPEPVGGTVADRAGDPGDVGGAQTIRVTSSLGTDLVIERVYRNLVRYGPLTPLLEDDDVWEIMINAPDAIFVKRHRGVSGYHDEAFQDDEHILRTLTKILDDASSSHRKLDPSEGLQDAQLDNGARLHIVHRDVGHGGHTMVNIRKFTGVAFRSLDELVERLAGASAIGPILQIVTAGATTKIVLSALAVFFSYLFAIPLGVWSAVRRGVRFSSLLTST